MSGYNPTTGWSHLTPSKLSRYLRPAEDGALDLASRFAVEGVELYWDAYGGLHVHCDEGRAWELLSGQPNTREVPPPGEGVEWISVSDMGSNFDPPLASATVLALLRKAGYLERHNGVDRPSAKAAGLYKEVAGGPAGRFPSTPTGTRRLWAFEILESLRSFHGHGR
jgi:hypothetical protein